MACPGRQMLNRREILMESWFPEFRIGATKIVAIPTLMGCRGAAEYLAVSVPRHPDLRCDQNLTA
jgi:hypothetical protein